MKRKRKKWQGWFNNSPGRHQFACRRKRERKREHSLWEERETDNICTLPRFFFKKKKEKSVCVWQQFRGGQTEADSLLFVVIITCSQSIWVCFPLGCGIALQASTLSCSYVCPVFPFPQSTKRGKGLAQSPSIANFYTKKTFRLYNRPTACVYATRFCLPRHIQSTSILWSSWTIYLFTGPIRPRTLCLLLLIFSFLNWAGSQPCSPSWITFHFLCCTLFERWNKRAK